MRKLLSGCFSCGRSLGMALALHVALLLSVTGISGAQSVTANIGAGSNPAAVAVNPVTNQIYIANQDGNSLTVIDGAANTTTTIGVGSAPVAVAVNPATNQIYVANSGSNDVTVIDGTTKSTTTVSVGTTPRVVAVNPVTNKIYVVNAGSNNVTVIDGASNGASNLNTGSTPWAIAINPVTNRIYVANRQGSSLTVIDGASNGTTTVGTSLEPWAVAVNPVTNKIYVAHHSTSNLLVLDGANLSSTSTISAAGLPYALAVNPVTNKIYVTNQDSGSVTVIDGTNTTMVAAGTSPSAVAVNSVTNQIYVANSGSNNLTVIDGSTNLSATISAGSSPAAVAVNPVTNKVYAVNQKSNNVTVIDGDSNRFVALPGGSAPWKVAVNPATNQIYVANIDDGNILVIDGATNATSTVNAGGGTGWNPTTMAVNPVTNKIYIAPYTSNYLTVIDGATNATSTIATPYYPRAVAVNPVSNRIYVLNSSTHDLTVIDGNSGASFSIPNVRGGVLAVNPVTNKIYVPEWADGNVLVIDGLTNTTSVVGAGTYPVAVAVNPVTNRIYVCNMNSNDVTVIDGATNTSTTILAGTQPQDVAVNPVTNKIYVVEGEGLLVIDGATNETVTIRTGIMPAQVAVNPVTNKIYVAVQGAGAVAVIDGATNTTIATLATGTDAKGVAVNPVTDKIYVANQTSGGVTVISAAPAPSIPLAIQVQGVQDADTLGGQAIFATTGSHPSFSATVTSSYAPWTPAPTALYYQLDTAQGSWQQAAATGIFGADPAGYNFSLSNVPLGVHTVYTYAVYGSEGSGDSPEIGNLTASTFAVVIPPTATTVTADVNPQAALAPVNFTASVKPLSGTAVPTGTVSFFDGSVLLGQQGLDGKGNASLTISTLAAGQHTITASYSGDANDGPSSGSVAEQINALVPAITWDTPAPITYGTPISDTQLNATVTVPGTLTYLQPAGSIMDAGLQSLVVLFRPIDHTYYADTAKVVFLTINKAAGQITCQMPAPGFYTTSAIAPCTVNSGANVMYEAVSGNGRIHHGDSTLLDLLVPSTWPGKVTVSSAYAYATQNYTAATITPATAQSFTFSGIPVNINCTYTPVVSFQNSTPAQIADLPSSVTYGDSGRFVCQSDNPNTPHLTYAKTATLKSTIVPLVTGGVTLTFKQVETVTLTVSARSSKGYAAATWPADGASHGVQVNPKAIDVGIATAADGSALRWLYSKSSVPVGERIKLTLANQSTLAFASDRLPVSGTHWSVTDAAHNPVTLAPASSPIGDYQITPDFSSPNYKVNLIASPLTIAPDNTAGVLAKVRPTVSTVTMTAKLGASKTAVVTVSNKTGEALNITAAAPGAPFTVSADPGCSNVSGVLPGGTCTFAVTFKPTATGRTSGTLQLNATNANTGDEFAGTVFTVQSVSLAGVGTK